MNEGINYWKWGVGVIAGVLAFIVLIFAVSAVHKSYSRYQKRADAENDVKVLSIKVQGQKQRVLIATQKAAVRLEEAKGIRNAQDKINATLTPLYVQHEMIQALSESGATTVYIPTDPASGLPVVTTRNAGGK